MTSTFAAISAIALTVMVAGQQPPSPTRAPAAPQGDAAKGREQFVTYKCSWCHGTEGQGGLPTVGPRVALVPRSLDSFIAYVRRPTGRMSAYSEPSVSDAVLTDIYAYLRGLPGAKAPKEIPMLEGLRKIK